VKRYSYSFGGDLRVRVPPAAEYEYENAFNWEISHCRCGGVRREVSEILPIYVAEKGVKARFRWFSGTLKNKTNKHAS